LDFVAFADDDFGYFLVAVVFGEDFGLEL